MLERKWHAVYTRPGREKRVAESMTKKRFRNYLPLNKIERPDGRGKKVVNEPLFPRYVFVQLSEDERNSFQLSGDIINFVYWLNQPVVIKNEEINAINYFLNEYSFTFLQKTRVNMEEHMQMINEPVLVRKGHVLEVIAATAKLKLPSLGHELIAGTRKSSAEELVPSSDSMIKFKVA